MTEKENKLEDVIIITSDYEKIKTEIHINKKHEKTLPFLLDSIEEAVRICEKEYTKKCECMKTWNPHAHTITYICWFEE